MSVNPLADKQYKGRFKKQEVVYKKGQHKLKLHNDVYIKEKQSVQ
jgi:hypothetical protein